MGIGDFNTSGNSSNNNQRQTESTYYSRLKFKSKDGKRNLAITYWSGLMIFDINDVDTSNGGYKSTQLEVIRLSPNKARLLWKELFEMKSVLINNKKSYDGKAYGVSAGIGEQLSYIGFYIDNSNELAVTIGKINGSGSILSSQSITIGNNDYATALEWDDINNMETVKKIQYNNIDLDTVMDALEDFYKHMSGGIAYSVADIMRYDNARVNKRFDALYDKLGIEKYNPGNGYKGGNNFLNNLAANNRSSNSVSMDSIEEMFDED